jgi:hypothetical protein
LFEVGLVVLARSSIRTEDLCLINVLPSIFASQHIVNLFALELDFVLKGMVDPKHVRAGLAEEAEV